MEAIIPIKPTARGFALTQILSKRARAAQSDVEGTKRALHALGYYDPDSENPLAHGFNGITDEALFEGIARLQSDYGLPVSGDIQPGGETERLIRSFLDHGPVSPEESDYLDMEDGEPLFFSLSRSVGFNGENRREDVQRLRDLFQSTGRYLPDRYNHGRPHKPEHLDEALHHAILTFQDEAGLTVDGLIQTAPEIPYIGDTRGETLDALTWYAGAVQEAGGPDLVDVRAYQQVRDGKTVSVSAHQRGIPGAESSGEDGSFEVAARKKKKGLPETWPERDFAPAPGGYGRGSGSKPKADTPKANQPQQAQADRLEYFTGRGRGRKASKGEDSRNLSDKDKELLEREKADPGSRIAPSESRHWKNIEKHGTRLSGKHRGYVKGPDNRYYKYDRGKSHPAEIEMWSKQGKHLGAFHPVTGVRVKAPQSSKDQEFSALENGNNEFS
ncbi:MAG: hypothetical protein ACPGOV_16715 [Magnetovibrionaceae bacterium]